MALETGMASDSVFGWTQLPFVWKWWAQFGSPQAGGEASNCICTKHTAPPQHPRRHFSGRQSTKTCFCANKCLLVVTGCKTYSLVRQITRFVANRKCVGYGEMTSATLWPSINHRWALEPCEWSVDGYTAGRHSRLIHVDAITLGTTYKWPWNSQCVVDNKSHAEPRWLKC